MIKLLYLQRFLPKIQSSDDDSLAYVTIRFEARRQGYILMNVVFVAESIFSGLSAACLAMQV